MQLIKEVKCYFQAGEKFHCEQNAIGSKPVSLDYETTETMEMDSSNQERPAERTFRFRDSREI